MVQNFPKSRSVDTVAGWQVRLPYKLECGDLDVSAFPGTGLPHDQLSQNLELPFRFPSSWCIIGVPGSECNCPIGSGGRNHSLRNILPFQKGEGSD